MGKKTKQELKTEYEGETYSGEIVDADPSTGENPVISPAPDVPNIIVEDEKAKDWTEGNRINLVKVTKVVPNENGAYMFGTRIKSDEEREKEKSNEFKVIMKLMGNKMTSQNFTERDDAQDMADFLESHVKLGRIEVKQIR